jgi:hypothetical protein
MNWLPFAELTNPIGPWLYLLPLVAAVSFVYCATRYERWAPILRHTVRLFFTILLFMLAIMVVIIGLQYKPRLTQGALALLAAFYLARWIKRRWVRTSSLDEASVSK